MIRINWNGFLEICCKQYPKEACAMLYAKRPFSSNPAQEWFVFPIKNVHNSPKDGWMPDNKELARTKKIADEQGMVKIGNIHSHPMMQQDDDIDDLGKPSDTDLQFARKFNDIIRGILVTDGGEVLAISWHDKFGNNYNIEVIKNG